MDKVCKKLLRLPNDHHPSDLSAKSAVLLGVSIQKTKFFLRH
jgi:hypothetical protein